MEKKKKRLHMVLMLTTFPRLSLTMLYFRDSAQTILVFLKQAKLL